MQTRINLDHGSFFTPIIFRLGHFNAPHYKFFNLTALVLTKDAQVFVRCDSYCRQL